ncbi:substrate-binding domain-containing protein [Streptomyces sp. DK15]|uniref:substrate-binding domain-containing protein n=1 Tax=Streptomyces sp. DK15 TaxID=2957499 RepID=UPI0029AEBB75|nr:substrate-binding domain-containing protein [Streptomyces sp. DK15]MDX2388781.1 substrate-binding domain-containing protein [Streptomyces sp. DK15]
MRPHVDQRQAQVLALVRARGSVRVADLAHELGVSPVTLRRDIEAMAARGEIHRMHGVISRVEATRHVSPEAAGSGRAQAQAGPGAGLVIGMVVPTTEYYYAEVVRGAREVVEARGARLTVGLTRYLPGEDRTQADRLLSTGADGLLLTPNWDAGSAAPGEGAWTAELDVPTVLVERAAPPGHPAAALDRVVSDHAHGAARAVQHLVEQGHRRIALASQETPTTARLRSGFEAAVNALGLEPAPPWPTTAGSGTTGSGAAGSGAAWFGAAGSGAAGFAAAGSGAAGFAAAGSGAAGFAAAGSGAAGFAAAGSGAGAAGSEIAGLSVADRFARTLDYLCDAVTSGGVTAALIHSDTDAIMLIPRLQARGVRVPEDLAVITYDDEVAGLADVPLSAVAPAKHEVGARAATLLFERLAGGAHESPRQHVELLPRLNIRA